MFARHRILIVDDEAEFTYMTAMALEGTGKYKVRSVNDATAAVAAARDFRPELILLDVMMPQMDGGDVLSQLQADPATHDIPVIFLTALVAGNESPFGGLTRGGHHFLPKPLSLGSLAVWMDRTLRDHAFPPQAVA